MKKLLLPFFILFFGLCWGQIIYQHNFGTATISTHPYIAAPSTINANLNSSSWTNSNNVFTSFAGSTGEALSLNNSGGTPTINLTFNVAAGFALNVDSFNFWRQRSTNGAQNWSMSINGTTVGSGTVPTAGASIGTTTVSTPITGLTGTINVVISLSGASGTGTFRLDDFTLNGTVVSTSAVDFCNLQSPATATITEGSNLPVYAKVYEAGVTEAAGAPVGINGWIGYSSSNNDPSSAGWTWVPATWNTQALNDDEFTANIGASLAAGTYYYASRFQLNGGSFKYGGFNGGFWNGTTNVNGVLTIQENVVDYCNVQFPQNGTVAEGAAFTVYAQVYEPGVTEAAGAGAGINAWIGYSTTNSNPNTWTNWVPATFNVQSGNNDEYQANIATGLIAGTYYYASRFQKSTYAFRYGGYNGGYWNGTTNASGVLTITGPDINVTGNAISIVSGDTTPATADATDYGNVSVGSNLGKAFIIENTGNSNLNLGAITLSGSAAFSIFSSPSNTTIAAGGNGSLSIFFEPTAAGIQTTVVSIPSNDPNENPYTFTLQGNGLLTVTAPEINVLGNAVSIPNTSQFPNTANFTLFNTTTIGANFNRTFTIQNTGNLALNLTGNPIVTISGIHANQYSIFTQPASNSVAAAGSVTFVVRFSPTSAGVKNAIITILNNDTDEGTYTFNITGNAKGANNIYVSSNSQDIIKGATTTNVTNNTNFGGVAVTTGIKQNTFVISNFSGASCYFANVTISGPDAAMFSVVSQPTVNSVANNDNTAFVINFTPTSVGIKNAVVTINTYTNSALSTPIAIDPTYTFAISGLGQNFVPCNLNAIQTIAQQDFETAPAAPVWAYTSNTNGVVNVTGGTFDNGSGAVNGFIGAQSYQFKSSANGSINNATINLAGINTLNYSNINMSLRLGAFRTGTIQGPDIGDLVYVQVSTDGGTNWSTEGVVAGYNNARFNFSTTGVFNCYYTGNNIAPLKDHRLSTGGGLELTGVDGTSTLNIKNLPSVSNLLIRVVLEIDRTDEIFAIDNIKIEGQIPAITTWNGTTWNNGTPTNSIKAVINGNYSTLSNGNIETCECKINTGFKLTVDSSTYLEVQSDIINDGIIEVASSGSLLQINNSALYTGNTLTVKRDASQKFYDYIYWSSPVIGFNVANVSPTAPLNKIYYWNTLDTNANGGQGNWNVFSGLMKPAEGYIIRGQAGFSTTANTAWTANFVGKPNNGVISLSVYRGNNTGSGSNGIDDNGDNWNLIGNPYPSAIDADAFINTYANSGNSLFANIEGSVRLWTHNTGLSTLNSNPFYQNFLFNYNSNNYIIYNSFGAQTGPSTFNGKIASGQAFFVYMNDGATADTKTIEFNNNLRNKTFDNSQFFRQSVVAEKHRIWLDLITPSNQAVRTLVGYTEAATNEKDNNFDAIAEKVTDANFYSLIHNEAMNIQAKNSFNTLDYFNLGTQITENGNHKIAIAQTDGLFSGSQAQTIYLEDKLLNVTHNLSTSPYEFVANTGVFNNRFVLKFSNVTLGNPNFNNNNVVEIYANNKKININSVAENINKVEIYDFLGRLIYSKNNLNQNEFVIENLTFSDHYLIVKATLNNGTVVNKKVVY